MEMKGMLDHTTRSTNFPEFFRFPQGYKHAHFQASKFLRRNIVIIILTFGYSHVPLFFYDADEDLDYSDSHLFS